MNHPAHDTRVTPAPGLAQILFVLVALACVLGFGPSYRSALTFSGKTFTPLVHVHVALMVVWIGMLVVQPWLIRTRRLRVHRQLGNASFLVVPLVLASTIAAARELLLREPAITVDVARIAVFNWGMVIALGGSWGLGLFFRRNARLHKRFMISTAFAIATAPLSRVLINWIPGFGETDVALAATASLILLPLLALIILDWRAGIRRSPYWFVTVCIAFMYLGYWGWGASQTWTTFLHAFAGST